MKLDLTVRKAMAISTLLTLILVTALAVVAWRGFSTAVVSIQSEHEVSQPSFAAMQNIRFNVVQVQQFLTDVSATLDGGGYAEAKKTYDEALGSLEALAKLQPDLAADVKRVREELMTFHAAGIGMAKTYIEKGTQAGNASMKEPNTGFDARAEQLTKDLEKMESTLRDRVKLSAQETENVINGARNSSLVLGLVVALMAVVSGSVLYRLLLQLLGGEPARAVEVAQRIAADDYSSAIEIRAGDQTSLMVCLRQMQEALSARIEKDRATAAETLRVKIALDNVSTGVMIADIDRNIIYANSAVKKVLAAAEAEIRKIEPGFSAERLVGRSMDVFHKNPQHQATMLARLSATHAARLQLGARHLTVTASPVITETGERVGTVAEWLDRTAEVQVQDEVAALVTAASSGDFAQRLSLDGKEGFFRDLSERLNQLSTVTSGGLNDVARVLQAISRGDLTQTIAGDYAGVFGQLKDDTNTTVARLREVIGRIQEAAALISTASQEIAAGNGDLSSRTEEQASSLEETSSSMEELNATVKQNADNARQANELARNSNDIASRGGEMVKQVVRTMSGIQESSKKIADIVGVIDSIAFQTNILALNAAVEAARAGEQGRGFAVVATEVRNLAQRSATAAKEVKELIAESVSQVEGGAKLVGTAGSTMDEVVTSFQQVTVLVTEISNASREQSGGIEQVTQAVSQMDEVTQQNAALVEEAAAAAESLEEQARSLVQAVGMFKLDGGSTTAGRSEAARPSRNLPTAALRTVSQRQLPRSAKPAAPRGTPGKQPPAHLAEAGEEWAEF